MNCARACTNEHIDTHTHEHTDAKTHMYVHTCMCTHARAHAQTCILIVSYANILMFISWKQWIGEEDFFFNYSSDEVFFCLDWYIVIFVHEYMHQHHDHYHKQIISLHVFYSLSLSLSLSPSVHINHWFCLLFLKASSVHTMLMYVGFCSSPNTITSICRSPQGNFASPTVLSVSCSSFLVFLVRCAVSGRITTVFEEAASWLKKKSWTSIWLFSFSLLLKSKMCNWIIALRQLQLARIPVLFCIWSIPGKYHHMPLLCIYLKSQQISDARHIMWSWLQFSLKYRKSVLS